MKIGGRTTVFCALLLGIVSRPKLGHAALPPEVVALMDTTVDPCDDFYQYSCGTWQKNTTIPSSKTIVEAAWTTIQTQSEVVIQQIVQDKLPYISELWDSCMDLTQLEKLGAKPLEAQLKRIVQANDPVTIMELAGQLRLGGTSFLTFPDVWADVKNASSNMLYVRCGFLVLDPSYYGDSESFSTVEKPYRTYISTIMKLAGFAPGGKFQITSPTQSQQQKRSVLDLNTITDKIYALEKTLAAWMNVPRNGDPFQFYNPITYANATSRYPLSFGAFARGLRLNERSSDLKPSSLISFDIVPYFDNLEKLLHTIDVVDLKLYLAFSYIDRNGKNLNQAFFDAQFQLYDKALNGQPEQSPRASICVRQEIDSFPDLIGKYYFQRMFDQEREDNAKLMVKLIEAAMADHIAKLDWLDSTTRAAAEAKLAKVANLIGHSTEIPQYPFSLQSRAYFDNINALSGFDVGTRLSQAGKPVDRMKWDMSAAEANAYYSRSKNQMVFPAAIFQPLLFNGSYHPAQNFGGVGAVIGHELTHGFDSSGRKYDGYGNAVNWWDDATAAEFEKRAQCMKDEYSQFVVIGENGKPLINVNGTTTITENIADNGGLSLSWDAYHVFIKSATNVKTNGVLPGEDDKLFFISYAQSYCSKARDSYIEQLVKFDSHSPDIARATVTVMNSAHFAPTFQCKTGTKMNPEKKCVIW